MKLFRPLTATALVLGLALITSFSMIPQTASAQGALMLSTGLTSNNGTSGVAFEVSIFKSTKIHRIWTQTYSAGNCIVELYYNPNGLFTGTGSGGHNNTGWISLGQATVAGIGRGAGAEQPIPIDIDMLLDPGDVYGFAIRTVGGTGVGYKSGTAPYIFSDSYMEINTQGWGGQVPNSWSFYPREFCGAVQYDEGCFFPDGVISYELLDANLQPTSFATVPGSVNLQYDVNYPDEASTVGVTVNFHNVITDAIVYTYNFTGNKAAGQNLSAIQNIPLPANVPTGYLRVEVIFNTKNSCMNYADYIAPSGTLLLLPPGAVMCIVWPGDTDNNGLVNYGDRASLNTYIHDANLQSSWLYGPTRFSVVGGMDYLAWRGQPSAPWNTPDGCYKDTDGNGIINNFDYIAIKLNWLRNNTTIPPKNGSNFSTVSFDMDQNFPNPFNPTTSIRYAAPERSQVRLVVTDMFGREIATLASETVEAGVHTAQFDAGQLASGTYIATINMVGVESGLTFNKTIKMALNK